MKKLILTVLCLLGMVHAFASDRFPSKPITLIVPYGAGGTDSQYRKLAELVRRELGQPVIVENKPGGTGTLAIARMARSAAPDGYTIAASTGPVLRQPHIMDSPYDPTVDLTWIAGLGAYTFTLTVRDDSPFQTLEDMIKWAKENPGKLTVATVGPTSSVSVSMMLLARAAGIEFINVPYKGGGELQMAILGGDVMVAGDSLFNIVPPKDGRPGVRAIASFDAERSPYMPNLRTVKESGYDIVQDAPYGIVGPKGMPPEVVRVLQNAFEKAVKSPENVELLKVLRQRARFQPSAEFTEWAKKTFEEERQMIKDLNLRALAK